MTPKVSIIVPFYNVEEYIGKCLDSILSQTLTNIEVLCVDDSSPDKSIEIVKQYAENDSRIKIIRHEINQGLGPARNTGLVTAAAPYVLFVDSDDYIAPDMVEVLHNQASQSGCDVVWCYANSVGEDGTEHLNKDIRVEGIFNNEQILADSRLYPSILPVWNKLYKRELIQGIRQLPIVSEDQPFLAEWLIHANKICIIKNALYYYRDRQGTLSKPQIHTGQNWEQYFYSHKLFFEILNKAGFSNESVAIQRQSEKRLFSIIWRLHRFNLTKQDTWEEQCDSIKRHLDDFDIPINRHSPMYVLLRNTLNCKGYSLDKLMKLLFDFTKLSISKNTWVSFCKFLLKYLSKKTIRRSYLFADAMELAILKTVSRLMKSKIWLIGERPDMAQENGLYLYRYLIENKPDIRAVYVTTEELATSRKLKSWVAFNSIRHKLYFLNCAIYANAHYNDGYPRTRFGKKRYPFPKKSINVFLQHGITYADVSPLYGKKTSDIDLFVCGALPEYNAVCQDYGYSENEVVLTGFPRFDGLHNYKTTNQILFMPTWRRNLASMSLEEFAATEYCKKIQELLADPYLKDFLHANNVRLVFCPHYKMQQYLSLFKESDYAISILSPQRIDVQQFLKESLALITDTSSVCFDFAYMHKPIIYYQWDYESFTKMHLAKGYYDFKTMRFGQIVNNMADLVNELKNIALSNWSMSNTISEKVNLFFPICDTHNCERIFNSIANYDKKN